MHTKVQFHYQITSPGNAQAKLCVLDKKVPLEINNSSNPLFDLLKGMVSLIYEPSHLWDEENICWIDWYNDMHGYKWVLSTPDGKALNVKLSFLEDIFDESSAKNILQATCSFQSFYKAIIQELDRFLKETGLLNYEQLWQKDEFPITYFLILKKYLIEHDIWMPSKSDDSNFSDELDLLQA